MNTEDDTFERLKGLTSDEMFSLLRTTYIEHNITHLSLYDYLVIECSINPSSVTHKRNELLRKYGWTHKRFIRETFP